MGNKSIDGTAWTAEVLLYWDAPEEAIIEAFDLMGSEFYGTAPRSLSEDFVLSPDAGYDTSGIAGKGNCRAVIQVEKWLVWRYKTLFEIVALRFKDKYKSARVRKMKYKKRGMFTSGLSEENQQNMIANLKDEAEKLLAERGDDHVEIPWI